jgi:hypothetical protein
MVGDASARACRFLRAPAGAVPPPEPYAEERIDLSPHGSAHVVYNEVRAYRQVPLAFEASTGDELMLSLTDSGCLLVLDLEAPSGQRWIQGAKPGTDGLRLRLPETGAYRLYVVMSSDPARTGKTADFQLTLRLGRSLGRGGVSLVARATGGVADQGIRRAGRNRGSDQAVQGCVRVRPLPTVADVYARPEAAARSWSALTRRSTIWNNGLRSKEGTST